MKEREALNVALDALRNSQDYKMGRAITVEAVELIEEALAQPEQDADRFCDANCTWSDHHPNCKYGFGVYSAEDLDKAWKSGYDNCKAQSSWTLEDVKKAWKRGYARAKKEQRQNRVGIYTTPPTQQSCSQRSEASTWVGLTPQERDEINEQVYGAVPHYVAFAHALEAKLKEKNT